MTEQGTMLDTKKIFGEKAKEEGFIPPFAHASARGYKFFDESPIPLGETLHEGAARFANPKAMVDLTPAQISVAVPELERVLSEDLGIDITTYAASYREDAFYIVRKLSEMKPEKLRAIGKESSRGLASLALELGMHQRQLPLPERDLLTTIPASGQPVGLADWMKAAFKTIKLETMETADRDTIALETKAILEAVETMDRQLRVAAIEGPAGEAVANLNQAKATAKKMVDDLNAIAKHISDVEARTSVVKLATETLNVISISSDIKIAKQVKFETPEKVLILHAGNALPDEQLSLYVEGGSLYDEQQVKLGRNAAVRYLKDVEKADIEEADYVVVVSDKTSAQIQDTHKGLGLEDEKVTCIKLPSSENPRALLPIPHINLAAKYTALCRDVTLGYQTDPGVMELLSGLYRIITPDPKFDIRRQLAAEIMIMSIRSLATVPINVKYEEMHRRMFYALWAV